MGEYHLIQNILYIGKQDFYPQFETPSINFYGARYYWDKGSFWLSVDPMSDKYPHLTSYNYCANNPVMLIDPDGREIWINGDDGNNYQYKRGNLYTKDGKKYKGADKFANQVKNDLNTLKKNGQKGDINTLEKSKNKHNIMRSEGKNSSDAENQYNKKNHIPIGSTILYNPESERSDDGARPAIIGLSHELSHSYDYNEGEDNDKSPFITIYPNKGVPWAEITAVKKENYVRNKMGLGLRRTYNGIDLNDLLPQSQQRPQPVNMKNAIDFFTNKKR